MKPVRAEQKGKAVYYYYPDGSYEVKSGNNIAIKTNNPGNLVADTLEGKKYEIGIYDRGDGVHKFAIFPDVETGEKALREYLLRKYKDDSIENLMYRYAPPEYNDTEAYIKAIENAGINRHSKVRELTQEQFDILVNTIIKVESGGKLKSNYTESKPNNTSSPTNLFTSSSTHTVRPGDTLSKIAKRYNVSVEDLLRANPWIKNPDHIEVGWKIKIPGYAEKVQENLREGIRRIDPLVIDLDGDGIELRDIKESNAMFDLTGSGFANKTGWISSGDAFLVWDRNNDNRINDISEMFGNANQSGFKALALYDTNRDGRIDAFDDVFKNLKLWQDRNGDGRTDEGELLSLSAPTKTLDLIFAFS